jgi:anti-sigma regulatory factor (Ser/Thr protein kinase)
MSDFDLHPMFGRGSADPPERCTESSTTRHYLGRPTDVRRDIDRACRTLAGMATVPVAGREELILIAEPASVREARSWLAGVATPFVDESKRADLQLVVTEIVSNAVRHGGSGQELLLAATPKPEFLCVQVTDDGPGLAPRPRAMTSDENGGFGLFIVERLTRRWGVTRENSHTRVWFEFDY